MRCPYCNDETEVLRTGKITPDGMRRKRECKGCGIRFGTLEIAEQLTFRVRKRKNEVVLFDDQKLLASILSAARKRPLADNTAVLAGLIDDVSDDIRDRGGVIDAADLGDLVCARLRWVDPIAYVRYATIHKRIDDIPGLRAELDRLDGT